CYDRQASRPFLSSRREISMAETAAEATVERPSRTPVGTVHIVDPHPLNWRYITWNTIEEPVRTDAQGHLVGAAMEESRWIDDRTLEVKMRRGVRFQAGEEAKPPPFRGASERSHSGG